MGKNMKNKILSVGILALALFFAGTIYAVGQGNNATTTTVNQTQQQNQVENQGEADQIQTQEQEGVNEDGNENEAEDSVEAQNQQGLESGNGNQNQNQEQNQEQKNNEAKNNNGSSMSEQRRSAVANAVQELLQVADRSGGIGKQVRVIAQEQNQNQEKLEANLQKIEERGTFMRFVFGPDYNEINSAQKLLEQNREQIQQLNQIKDQLSNQGDIQSLSQQIQTLEQTHSEIGTSLEGSQKGFSLFGWMFKLFSK